jgi:heme/copper-type cytochrome/quinol oxidase subunit 3
MTERTLDVSELPTEAFGHRSLPWWATLGFMLIEGTTLAVAAASLLYLRRNFPEWPPRPSLPPDLLIPTINLVVILLVMVPMRAAGRAADRLDSPGVQRALAIAVGMTGIAIVLRAFEFAALNVRWDDHAYASVLWLVLGFHTTLLVTDFFETGVIYMIFRLRKEELKHYSDVEDAAMYQYFLSSVWAPLYVLVFLGAWIL